jgi:hypothetical protein
MAVLATPEKIRKSRTIHFHGDPGLQRREVDEERHADI